MCKMTFKQLKNPKFWFFISSLNFFKFFLQQGDGLIDGVLDLGNKNVAVRNKELITALEKTINALTNHAGRVNIRIRKVYILVPQRQTLLRSFPLPEMREIHAILLVEMLYAPGELDDVGSDGLESRAEITRDVQQMHAIPFISRLVGAVVVVARVGPRGQKTPSWACGMEQESVDRLLRTKPRPASTAVRRDEMVLLRADNKNSRHLGRGDDNSVDQNGLVRLSTLT